MRYLILFIVVLSLGSCKQIQPKIEVDESVKQDSLKIDTPEIVVKFIEFTPEFIVENKIDQWPDFIVFKDAIEDISKLNPEGIVVFLKGLQKLTFLLLKSPHPEPFNSLPIFSRIRVVQTQINKCYFYASNNQNEKLNEALKLLYKDYNILLERMISIGDEKEIKLEPEDSELDES
jgi:hypothetical protein